MILKAGLTGGIASGKSTVAGIFAGLGAYVVDADKVVRELYRPGREGFDIIVEHYGPGILDDSGHIDRPKLARIAFSSPKETERINRLIHPLVIARERRMIENEMRRFPDLDRIMVVEATLLLESGGRDRYDRIVVVDAPPELQLQRAVGRGMTRRETQKRMRRQMPREERVGMADYVIRNDESLEELHRETIRVYHRLVEDLEKLIEESHRVTRS